MICIAVDNSKSMEDILPSIRNVLINIWDDRELIKERMKLCVFGKEVREIKSPSDIVKGGRCESPDFKRLLLIGKGVKRIILISDGGINGIPPDLKTSSPIFTVGIGVSNKGEEILKKIAEDTTGEYVASDIENLQVILKGIIEGRRKEPEKYILKLRKELWKDEIIPLDTQEQSRLEKKCRSNLREFESLLKEEDIEKCIEEAGYILADFGTLKAAGKALILKSPILKSALENGDLLQNLWIINVTPIGVPLGRIIRDILAATKEKLVETISVFVDAEGNYDDDFPWWWAMKKEKRKERCVVVSPIIVAKMEGAIKCLSSIWDIKEIRCIINLSNKNFLTWNKKKGVEIGSVF